MFVNYSFSEILFMDSFSSGKFLTNQTFGNNIRELISLEDIPIYFNQPVWLRIEQDNICLDVFIYLRQSSKLYVLGQDALIEGRNELPYFYRSKWFNDLDDGSFITFNDPTLYLDRSLFGGWWQQNGSVELARKFIENLSKKISVKEEDIVCYGASAGGYFVLALAGLLRKSKVVADIAQVDLPTSPYKHNVPLLKKAGIERFKDIFYYWSRKEPPQNIYFLMNEKDISHIKTQLFYFLEKINIIYTLEGNMIKNLSIIKYKNNDINLRGHSPWEKDSLIKFLKKL